MSGVKQMTMNLSASGTAEPIEVQNDVPDAELVRRSLRADQAGFELLAKRYLSQVHAVAYANLRDRDAAQDLAQEVFLRAYLHLGRLEDPERFAPWLFRITRNLCISWQRNGQRTSKVLPMIPLEEMADKEPPTPGRSPREAAALHEQTGLLHEALQKLDAQQREIVLLHYGEGLSKSEIARLLGIHNSSVCRQIEKALERLRKELTSALPEAVRVLRQQSPAPALRSAVSVAGIAALSSSAKAALLAATADTAALGAASCAAPGLAAAIVGKLSPALVSGGSILGKAKLLFGVAAIVGMLGTGALVASRPPGQSAAQGKAHKPPQQTGQISESAKTGQSTSPSAAKAKGVQESPDGAAAAVPWGVQGRIVDEAGKPVAGAEILALSDEESTQGPGTRSSLDGSFAFEKLSGESAILDVSSPDYVPAAVKVSPSSNQEVLVRLTQGGGSVAGHVFILPDGEGATSACVTLTPVRQLDKLQSLRPRRAFTSDLGEYRLGHLAAGAYRLDASKGQALRMLRGKSYADSLLKLKESETTSGVDLRLYAGHTVYGQVIDRETSTPIAGAKIVLGHNLLNSSRGSKVLRSTLSKSDGSYEIRSFFCDLPGAEITAQSENHVAATASDASGRTESINLSPEELVVRHDLAMLPTVEVSGTLRRENGQPAKNGKVRLVRSNGAIPEEGVCVDAEGRYRLRVASYEVFCVRGEAPGNACAYSRSVQMNATPVSGLDITLHKGVAIRGQVTDEQGHPIGRATVTAKQSLRLPFNALNKSSAATIRKSDTAAEKTTDGSGRFSMEIPASQDICLNAQAQNLCPSSPVWLRLEPGQSTSALHLVVGQGHFMSGKITTPGGKPVCGAEIFLSGLPESWSARTQSDALGRYRFEHLRQDTEGFSVCLLHPDYADEFYSGIKKLDRNDADFTMGSADSYRFIGTVVRAGNKEPVDDFKVTCKRGTLHAEKAPSKPGTFEIGNVAWGTNEKFLLEAPGCIPLQCTTRAPLHKGEVNKATIVVGPGGSLAGQLVDRESAKPLAGYAVSLCFSSMAYADERGTAVPRQDGWQPCASVRTDAQGNFRFERLDAEEYELLFQTATGQVAMRKRARVEHGKTTDLGRVEMGDGGRIRGRIVSLPGEEPLASIRIILSEGSVSKGETVSGPDGSFEFKNLSEGYYVVQSSAPPMTVEATLKENQTRQVELRVGTCTLRGRVMRGATGHRATVSIGDASSQQGLISQATDSEGRFEISGLVEGLTPVFVYSAQDSRWRIRQNIEIRSQDSSERVITLPSGGRIVGRVLSSSGTPAPGVRLKAQSNQGSDGYSLYQEPVSDQNGSFCFEECPAGKYMVTAMTAEQNPLRASALVDVPEGGDSKPVELRLAAKTGTLISTAYDMASGQPMAKAWCEMWGMPEEYNDGVTRDQNGVLTRKDIPPGRYTVEVGWNGYSRARHEVEIREGETTRIDDVLCPAGSIKWSVQSKNGATLQDVRCRLVPSDPTSIESPREGVPNGRQGEWEVSGLLPGLYSATATIEGGQSVSETFLVEAGKECVKATRMP